MSNGWSRSDRIALIGIVIAVVSCIAALMVVPELRSWLGLEREASGSSASSDNSKTVLSNSDGSKTKSDQASQQTDPANKKVAGIFVQPNSLAVRGDIKDHSGTETYIEWRILIQDFAVYSSGQSYLTLSVCNMGGVPKELRNLYVWYTPANGTGSMNWYFKRPKIEGGFFGTPQWPPLFKLKPNECATTGDWNNQENNPVSLSSPLGILHISKYEGSPHVSIDLGKAESVGALRLLNF